MAENLDKTGGDISLEENVLIRPEDYQTDKPSQAISYPCLQMIAGPKEGLIIPLTPGELTIGRSRSNSLRLEDTSVSRRHARLTLEGERLTVQDLGSRNGVHLNGKRVPEGEDHVLAHQDQIKLGIYVFRLMTKPLAPEAALPAESPSKAATFVADSDADPKKEEPRSAISEPMLRAETSLTERDSISPKEMEGDLSGVHSGALEKMNFSTEPFGGRFNLLKTIFFIICGVSVVAGLSYLIYWNVQMKKTQTMVEVQPELPPTGTVKPEAMLPSTSPPSPVAMPQPAPSQVVQPETLPPEPIKPEAEKTKTDTSVALQGESVQPQAGKPEADKSEVVKPEPAKGESSQPLERVLALPVFNIFLDIASEPTSARIYFEGESLGQTPLKVSVPVMGGQEYVVTAEFDLKDIHDKYQQKLNFKADPRQEVVPLEFKGEIGVIKIQKLPREVSFYLEGYYAYDKYKANPVKLSDIVYGKPVYVPFGNYVIELREKTRVGESDTYVDEIRYHREFEISADRRVIELSVDDRDLQFFPAEIHSVPSGADIYLDGQRVGATPFSGELPLGKHELKLTREGFFDQMVPLDMRMNTQYETTIQLKTSKVGEFINKAREYRHSGEYQEAINELVEALKLEGSDREKAEIHLLLGDSYAMIGNNQNALTYFEQAKAHKDFYYRALLGLARVQFATGNRTASLTSLVEVLLNVADSDPLKKEALSLFRQLSPLKSVLYISTDPAGAMVFLNNREIQQKTPVIISDLSLGNYRIEIQKTGFEPQQVRTNLKLTEFVPVIMKLKPQKL